MSTESDLSPVFSAEAAIEKNFLKPQSFFRLYGAYPYSALHHTRYYRVQAIA